MWNQSTSNLPLFPMENLNYNFFIKSKIAFYILSGCLLFHSSKRGDSMAKKKKEMKAAEAKSCVCGMEKEAAEETF
jgi:large-conductance mechanosensitive channel